MRYYTFEEAAEFVPLSVGGKTDRFVVGKVGVDRVIAERFPNRSVLDPRKLAIEYDSCRVGYTNKGDILSILLFDTPNKQACLI